MVERPPYCRQWSLLPVFSLLLSLLPHCTGLLSESLSDLLHKGNQATILWAAFRERPLWWETKGFLPTAAWVSVEADPCAHSSLQMTATLTTSWLPSRKSPWVRTNQYSSSWILDPEKPYEIIKVCHFKSLRFAVGCYTGGHNKSHNLPKVSQ